MTASLLEKLQQNPTQNINKWNSKQQELQMTEVQMSV